MTTDPQGKGAPAQQQPPLIEYPLDYTFKVMGLAAADFAEHARALVAAVVPGEVRVTVRESSKGKYQSVSVVVRLEAEEQRRKVYEALHADERVLFYL